MGHSVTVLTELDCLASCFMSPVNRKDWCGVFFLELSSVELLKSFSREQRDILVWKEMNLALLLSKDLMCFLMKNVAL